MENVSCIIRTTTTFMSTYSTVVTQLRRRYNDSLQSRINLIAKILLFELQLLRNVKVEFSGICLGLSVVYMVCVVCGAQVNGITSKWCRYCVWEKDWSKRHCVIWFRLELTSLQWEILKGIWKEVIVNFSFLAISVLRDPYFVLDR